MSDLLNGPTESEQEIARLRAELAAVTRQRDGLVKAVEWIQRDAIFRAPETIPGFAENWLVRLDAARGGS